MKVVVAMDSFKESLTSVQASNAVKDGILSAVPDARVTVLPIGDGGEGTLEAILSGTGGEKKTVKVCGPLGHEVSASYGIIDGSRAVIEMAQAAGLSLLPPDGRNPLNTTTRGVGEIILDALDEGIRDFVVGLGGSATNDGGLGMLEALGYRFLDSGGQPAGIYGRDVASICEIDISRADSRLKECRFRLASDVTNPLLGEYGATAVFGPQKGATPPIIAQLEAALTRYSGLAADALKRDLSREPGAGAAGGLGFAFQAFLNARMHPGVEVVMEAVGFENAVRDADIAVTGEGKLDAQTMMGKAPSGVARAAKKHGVVVIALSGSVEGDVSACNEYGIDAFFSILNKPQSVWEAMERQNAEKNLRDVSEQAFRLIRAVRKP